MIFATPLLPRFISVLHDWLYLEHDCPYAIGLLAHHVPSDDPHEQGEHIAGGATFGRSPEIFRLARHTRDRLDTSRELDQLGRSRERSEPPPISLTTSMDHPKLPKRAPEKPSHVATRRKKTTRGHGIRCATPRGETQCQANGSSSHVGSIVEVNRTMTTTFVGEHFENNNAHQVSGRGGHCSRYLFVT